MLKKILTLLLLSTLLLPVFSACGGNSEDQSKVEPSASPAGTSSVSQTENSSETEGEPSAGPAGTGYELVWSDEFDYEGAPDPEKWTYDTGASGWGNNELQYYSAGENAEVKDGKLVIELRKDEDGLYEYTSSRMITKGRGEWTYGKFEVRAKLPRGLGTWPAAWMMPATSYYGSWPSSGELDIMEHVGYDQDVIVQTVHTTAHHGGDGVGHSQKTAGVSDDFHTYALEWLPDKLIFSIDGVESFTYDPKEYSDEPDETVWPFDKPFYFILNLAFGGNWGGAQGTDDSYFPVQYEVDYVRVYQNPEISPQDEGAGE